MRKQKKNIKNSVQIMIELASWTEGGKLSVCGGGWGLKEIMPVLRDTTEGQVILKSKVIILM